ncbi:GspE/PulE family protein [Celerinatantimonas sp. MCCC 1A17872]|uniref:GspE/PulE family protein n=1 Tax=Celerinatantimonas sp. MCCC 1A17872 TaxID=3177514 RepID=UPI0038C2F8CD
MIKQIQTNQINNGYSQLCEWLLAHQYIGKSELSRAHNVCDNTEQLSLIDALLELGLVSAKSVAQGWCELFEYVRYQPSMLNQTVDTNLISTRFLRFYRVFPIGLDEDTVQVVTSDPCQKYPLSALRYALEKPVRVLIATDEELSEIFSQQLDSNAEHTHVASDAHHEDDIAQLRDLASEAPIVRFVNTLFQQALELRASDIHIEPFENSIQVRYRIDGVLHERPAPAYRDYSAIVSRIKIMANLDIAQRRLPQDGRIMQRIQGKELDLRVSTVPTQYGESVVMRLLDRDSVRLSLDKLGFSARSRSQFEQLLAQPNGIVLVTGPTGSGKTTSLYSALSSLNDGQRKILTVEDPVEYQLDGINQIQVNPAIDFDFADALRSIVRQDPDVIMVGEMRDQVTAQMAIQASLTGHLVLSTLHTNNAPASIIRMLDMGLEPYLVSATLKGILAQRLVRRLDPQTRIAFDASDELIARYQLQDYCQNGRLTLYRADPDAPGGGYQGRIVIGELLILDEHIRENILHECDVDKLTQLAIEAGMQPMLADGMRQVAQGLTTIEEVLRVAGDTL